MYLLYVTFAVKTNAQSLARLLVEEGLISCANISSEVTSVYKWEDKIQENQEVIMFCKVPDAKLEQCMARIKQLHDYDCPCILAFKPDKVDKDFLKWVET